MFLPKNTIIQATIYNSRERMNKIFCFYIYGVKLNVIIPSMLMPIQTWDVLLHSMSIKSRKGQKKKELPNRIQKNVESTLITFQLRNKN